MQHFRLWLALLLGLLSAVPAAHATHIVGGEIEFTHQSDNLYTVSLIMYFDLVNGDPGARDPFVDVAIFRKSDNRLMGNLQLPLTADTAVPYTSPECAIGGLQTARLVYSNTFEFNPNDFNDTGGYYLVYERCCRNGTIRNISDPGGAGQAFYLEIPPLMLNGSRFINSSPSIFPPLSDYACVGQPFYFDFGGTDADGDSLTYALVAPLNGFSSRAAPSLPTPVPGPYPEVGFLPPFSAFNMISGNPAFAINQQTGFITLTPTQAGLFVFSVRIREFRNGEQIGELRRDYQMLVLNCERADAPEFTSVTAPTGAPIADSLTVIEFELDEDNRCFSLQATDISDLTQYSGRIIPIAGNANDLSISGPFGQSFNANTPFNFDVCVAECVQTLNDTLSYLVVIEDNSCPLPLADTVRLNIKVNFENEAPELSSTLPLEDTDTPDVYYAEIAVGELLDFSVFGTDPDLDSLRLDVLALNEELARLGLQLETTRSADTLISRVSWQPTCENLGASFEDKLYELEFFLTDFNACGSSEFKKDYRSGAGYFRGGTEPSP